MTDPNLKSATRAKLLDSLALHGFRKIERIAYEAHTRDVGEILRYFSPHIVIKNNGIIIIGKIGIMAPEFEKKWKESKGENATYAPLGMLLDNCRTLVDFPLFNKNSLAEVPAWIEKIARELEGLPSNRESLREAAHSGYLSTYPLHFFYIPNEKSNLFIKWLE